MIKITKEQDKKAITATAVIAEIRCFPRQKRWGLGILIRRKDKHRLGLQQFFWLGFLLLARLPREYPSDVIGLSST